MARPKVALFVTCLVDIFRPRTGFAAAKLLETAGCEVVVPVQTCCGQPAYNAGDAKDAATLARQFVAAFEPYEFVVAPSASCTGMVKTHYPKLLAPDDIWGPRAAELAGRTHELFSFLVNVRGLKRVDINWPRHAVYHNSCSALREIGVAQEPRTLLSSVCGLTLHDIADDETCCGFGGFFSIKFPEISTRLADDKIANVTCSRADTIVGGDLGCLLHLAGRLSRCGKKVRVCHAAEILAGMGDVPAIGEDEP